MHQICKIHPAFGSRNEFLINLTIIRKYAEGSFRHRLFHLEQRNISVTDLFQSLVHRLQQIISLVFLNHQIGIANDPEKADVTNFRSRKKFIDVAPDYIFQKDKDDFVLSTHRLGNFQKSWQNIRNLDPGEFGFLIVSNHHRKVHAEAGNVRKRMPRIKCHRSQHRINLVHETPMQILLDPIVIRAHFKEFHSVFF